MLEDFRSILFRYLTNGIKTEHFNNKEEMVKSIKNDCLKVKNGYNLDMIIKQHRISLGIEPRLVKVLKCSYCIVDSSKNPKCDYCQHKHDEVMSDMI